LAGVKYVCVKCVHAAILVIHDSVEVVNAVMTCMQ